MFTKKAYWFHYNSWPNILSTHGTASMELFVRAWDLLCLVLVQLLLFWVFSEAKPSLPATSTEEIRCGECREDGCLDVTIIWRSKNPNYDVVWNGKGKAIPECRSYKPSSQTWYHVCRKNHSVFIVTNDSEEGVSFAFEGRGKSLQNVKPEKDCPKLEQEVEGKSKMDQSEPGNHSPGLQQLCLVTLILAIRVSMLVPRAIF